MPVACCADSACGGIFALLCLLSQISPSRFPLPRQRRHHLLLPGNRAHVLEMGSGMMTTSALMGKPLAAMLTTQDVLSAAATQRPASDDMMPSQ